MVVIHEFLEVWLDDGRLVGLDGLVEQVDVEVQLVAAGVEV